MRSVLAAACLAVLCCACASEPDSDSPSTEPAFPDPRLHGPQATPIASGTPAESPTPTVTPAPTPWPMPTPLGAPLTLVRKLPHANWSEGLDYHAGELWGAFPHSMRVYEPETGTPLRDLDPPSAYSESLAWRDGELWNVSYDDNNIYVGTPEGLDFTWRVVGTVPEIHSWGITHDPWHVIVTGNGTPFLYFLDPVTTEVMATIETPIDDLEDLAWDRGAIWASSYSEYSGKFFRLNPWNGELVDVFALPDPAECSIVDGVAVNGSTLFVTGKNCPWIYVYEMP